jgi:hypothetical protein
VHPAIWFDTPSHLWSLIRTLANLGDGFWAVFPAIHWVEFTTPSSGHRLGNLAFVILFQSTLGGVFVTQFCLSYAFPSFWCMP